MKVNFTFVGGCFSVQNNSVEHYVEPQKIFHQLLKHEIETTLPCNLNINIIRYERFQNCLKKIKLAQNDYPIDILVFHIRPEPFIRLCKFYYKYVNEDGKICRSLNLPLLKIINPEKYDSLVLGGLYPSNKISSESRFHKSLIDINYIFGFLALNVRFAMKAYLKLIDQIRQYCHEENIDFIVLGPPSRPHTKMENLLCSKLHQYAQTYKGLKHVKYVKGLGEYSETNDAFFFPDGMHATEAYHRHIAKKLSVEFEEIIKKKISETKLNQVQTH